MRVAVFLVIGRYANEERRFQMQAEEIRFSVHRPKPVRGEEFFFFFDSSTTPAIMKNYKRRDLTREIHNTLEEGDKMHYMELCYKEQK